EHTKPVNRDRRHRPAPRGRRSVGIVGRIARLALRSDAGGDGGADETAECVEAAAATAAAAGRQGDRLHPPPLRGMGVDLDRRVLHGWTPEEDRDGALELRASCYSRSVRPARIILPMPRLRAFLG